jgi:epoxyqueuosine reductase
LSSAEHADAKARILRHAKSIGFDLVGIAGAAPFENAQQVMSARVAAGYLGQWRYTDDIIRTICTPSASLPQARSIVCTATAYGRGGPDHDPYAPGLRGAVSRYAWGPDYHRVIGGRLRELAEFMRSEFDGAACLACVDTGPLVDRAAAVRAGIGWYGKNGNVLTKEFGSWVLLGAVITTLDLEPDAPMATNCGHCEVCVDRCPTQAIGPDGAVDARRCISDLTQLKTPIPRGLRKAIGNRVWGCDDCQTPCPVNLHTRDTSAASSSAARPAEPPVGTSVDLPAVLRMTKSQFREWFGPTSMAWRGKAVLQRNAAVALGNSRDARAVPHLIASLEDRKALVRGHAAWALGELGGDDACAALRALLERESDPTVREEAQTALETIAEVARSA